MGVDMSLELFLPYLTVLQGYSHLCVQGSFLMELERHDRLNPSLWHAKYVSQSLELSLQSAPSILKSVLLGDRVLLYRCNFRLGRQQKQFCSFWFVIL